MGVLLYLAVIYFLTHILQIAQSSSTKQVIVFYFIPTRHDK